MKAKYIYILISFFMLLNLNQAYSTAIYRYGPWANKNDFGNDVIVDNSGNTYVTGRYHSGLGVFSFGEIITLKYPPGAVTGDTWEWARVYKGDGFHQDSSEGKKITLDNLGNVYVTGTYDGFRQLVTIKYDPAGNEEWSSSITASALGLEAIPKAIEVDNVNGYVYVAGNIELTGGLRKYITIRYPLINPSGINTFHIHTSGINTNDVAGLVLDEAGNIYVTGSVYNGSNYDFVTLKYTGTAFPAAPTVWTYNSGNSDFASSIAIDKVNNYIYVVGSSYSAATNYDYTVVRYTASGLSTISSYNNTTYNGSDKAVSVLVSPYDQSVFVTGESYNGTTQRQNIVTLKYTLFGVGSWPAINITRKWGRSPYIICFGCTPIFGNDIPTGMTLTNNGSIYITGYSENYDNFFEFDYVTLKYDVNLRYKCNSIYDAIPGAGFSYDVSNAIAPSISGGAAVTGGSASVPFGIDIATIKYSGNCVRVGAWYFYNYTLSDVSSSTTTSSLIDTATIEIRSSVSPYNVIKSYTNGIMNEGVSNGEFCSEDLDTSQSYYLVIKHRNSIETWSANPVQITGDSLFYSFSTNQSQAYGNNLYFDGTRWLIYRGDCNQDGVVNLADVLQVYNAATNFVNGYTVTDVNDDQTVNLTDIIITSNNNTKFVTVKRPL
ncbi:MAG: SBBP repeat-containing protein [Ignavibacteria bacterium]